MIEGVITAGAAKPARVADCQPVTVTRVSPGLNLPLAGAVLLHLALLVLALLTPRLDEGREQMVEVFPIHLYSAAEEAVSLPEPVTPTVRQSAAVPPAQAEVRTVPFLPLPQVQELAPVVVLPAAEAVVSLSVAPTMDLALVQSGGTGGFSQAEAAESIAVPVSIPNGAAGAVIAAPAVLPEGLAQPLYRVNQEPEYPALARRRWQEGTVVLEALVTPEGTVGGLLVHQSSGHSLLDEAALKGVKGWRFVPGRRGTTPVAMKVLVPVRFGLR